MQTLFASVLNNGIDYPIPTFLRAALSLSLPLDFTCVGVILPP